MGNPSDCQCVACLFVRFGKPNFREGDANNKACANCTQEDICVLDLCFGAVSHYKDKLMMLGKL